MTREEFIEMLDRAGYSYEIEGDKIVVTHKKNVFLGILKTLPPGVEFKNEGDVGLTALTSISPGVDFKNKGFVYLASLTTIPSGVFFGNRHDVYLDSLVGGPFLYWKGNIKGMDSKRLLNLMISKGLFER